MKLATIPYALALLLAPFVLASEPEDKPTPTVSAEGNYSTTPPELALEQYLEHGNNLAQRQVGAGNLNGAATAAVAQVPAITTFYMASAIGTTATWVAFTYTQTFAPIPDQWPSPVAGEIGLGTLVKQGKRDAAPTPAPSPAGLAVGDPLVLELQNVRITQPVTCVMEVTELVEVPEHGNSSTIANHTASALNQTTGSITNITSAANVTSIANMTWIVNTTSTHSIKVLPSQMNPEFARTLLTTAS